MIRVNLLQPIGHREGRIESLIRTGGASAFITRGEVLLALGCLAIAAGVLVFQSGGSGEQGRADSVETPLTSPPKQPLVRDIDADRQTASGETPGALSGSDVAADTAGAVGVDETAPGDAIASNLEPLTAETSSKVEPPAPATPSTPSNPTRSTPTPSPPPVDATPKPSQQPPAAAPVLQQLVVSAEGETLRIFAATGTQPEYSTFRLDNPKRIVIDLPGVRLSLPREQHDQTLDHPQVSRIRAGQHQTNPPRARIVLDVNSYPEVEALPQFNGLYLIVTERPR
ncbi:MAG TPA: AMIN domain-containing protein [Bryobacterales bacterium]|nr:AMIN domain-containing protein [Bryobacterales bacterium]